MSVPVLHGYFRSSASFRVRIALHLKGLAYRDAFRHLGKGEQREAAFLALNPQGFLPTLEADGAVLTQSLAICEYLDEVDPEPPLLPSDPIRRAQIRAFAQVIACDIHPLQNLRVLGMLREQGVDAPGVRQWAATVIASGFDTCAALIAAQPGPYCFGPEVTLADICLVPQLANARRFGVDLRWPRLLEVEAACMALPAFQAAAPDAQGDAE